MIVPLPRRATARHRAFISLHRLLASAPALARAAATIPYPHVAFAPLVIYESDWKKAAIRLLTAARYNLLRFRRTTVNAPAWRC